MSTAIASHSPAPASPVASVAAAKPKSEKPLASLFAGATAGAIEGFVTYPTEFAKTQLQFASSGGAGKSKVVASDGMGGVGAVDPSKAKNAVKIKVSSRDSDGS